MERAIRIGKDFNVRWSIRKRVDGELQPYELAGKELVLQYRRPNGTLHEAKEWRVDGNIIIWTFRGRDQKAPGSYELILTENGGKDGMVTVDTCRAFKLVAHSCEETDGSGGDIVIEDVVLESEVTFAALRGPQGERGPEGPQGPQGERGPQGEQGPAGPSYDDTEIKGKLAELSEANEVLKEAQQFTDVAIKDLQDMKIDRENDDYYPKMAVGLADNLAGVDVVDSEINFRRSGGGAITDGVARIETIKGNSVVWNQLLTHYSADANRIQLESDGVTYAIGGEITGTLFQKVGYTTHSMIAGHKYYIRYEVLSGNLAENANHVILNGSTRIQPNKGLFITADSTTAVEFSMRVTPEALGSKFHFTFYDLTQMFGSGNEPTTTEEFYQRAPMGVDLNAYNEGEVIHMDVQSVESVGVNQWDEEWEQGGIASASGLPITLAGAIRSKNFSPIFPSTSYYVNWAAYTGDKYIFFYDREQNFISKSSFASNGAVNTPSNAAYFKIRIDQGSSFHKDICINRYDTAINGQYFPYIKRQEDLSIIRKYFPEGMKSTPTTHDAIRYNNESGKREKVEAVGVRAYQEGDADNAAYLTDSKVTCYPLAEPIVTELDEADQFKDWDYSVWNDGTERANAEGKSAPLAADITYGFNAIGKIKELESLVAALRAKVGI